METGQTDESRARLAVGRSGRRCAQNPNTGMGAGLLRGSRGVRAFTKAESVHVGEQVKADDAEREKKRHRQDQTTLGTFFIPLVLQGFL